MMKKLNKNMLRVNRRCLRWTKPWRADGEGFIAFTQGTDIVKGSPDKSGSSTNKMKLTSGIFLGCAVAAYLNVMRQKPMEYLMTQIYEDGTYLDNNPGWHEEDSPWKAKQIDNIIKKNSLNPKTICEVGCGAGEILNQLSKLNVDGEFIGYEISPQAFELCSKKSKANLTFRLADLLKDDIAHFDIVMAIDVFEHVEDYFGFLRKLKEKAEYKIFHIPLDLSVQTVFRSSPILKGRKRVGHIHYFTKETALETLKDTGYSIIDYFYTGGSLELPNRGWKANLLKIPRKLAFSLNKDLAVRLLGGYSLMVLTK